MTYLKSTSITAVEIPEGVTKIGNSAFQFCMSMESVLLPESLEHIGTSAFATCRKLSTINWPHNLKYVGANAFLYDSAYKGEIWLAKGITVEDGAFTGMFAAKKVTLDGQPAKIGEGAFNECTALTELYVNCTYPPQFDPAVVFEDDWGDSYCADITLYVPGGAIPNYEAAPLWANVFGSIEEAEFTNTDTTKPGGSGDEPSDREYEIYTDTWSDDGTIAILNVPEAGSLSALLGEKAGNIEELHLSGKLNGTDILQLREMAGISQSGSIIEGAKLKTLDILNTEIVEGGEPYYSYLEVCYTAQDEVGDKMFSYSRSLESVILPKYAISIGDDAFAQCGALKEITIGEYVKSVGELAFYYDLGLTHIELPASCTRIADMAFYACGALEKVDIPGEVTKIGEATFYFCTSLKDFISEKAYATADVWSEFMNLHSVGVEKVVTPDRFVIERYNIDGKGASGNAKGLIIVRYSDGTVAKQIVK